MSGGNAPLSPAAAAPVAEVFATLADPTRLRILHALREAERTTSDLATALSLSDSAVSHQVRTLRQTRAVVSRRSGKQVWHRLADAHIRALMEQGLAHAAEQRAP